MKNCDLLSGGGGVKSPLKELSFISVLDMYKELSSICIDRYYKDIGDSISIDNIFDLIQ